MVGLMCMFLKKTNLNHLECPNFSPTSRLKSRIVQMQVFDVNAAKNSSILTVFDISRVGVVAGCILPPIVGINSY